MTRAIGFDIGGSTIRAGRVRFQGSSWQIEARRRIALRAGDKSPDQIVATAHALASELAAASPGGGSLDELPVGIGIPAQLDPSGRHVANAPNLGWRDVAIGERLDAQFGGARLRVDNDLNVILIGEQRFGAAKGCRNIVAIYPGTGVGGAVMVDGRIVRGSAGFAGEVGHVGMHTQIPCGCGETGCLETIGGGRYIEARVARERAQGRFQGAAFQKLEVIRVNHVDAAYAASDPDAQAVWADVIDVLSELGGIASALLNPEMVLLGGGVIAHAPNLQTALAEAIVARSPEVCRPGLLVAVGALGSDAGVLGAAALAVQE
jgi:glucokinase